jgi:hypothetical protein
LGAEAALREGFGGGGGVGGGALGAGGGRRAALRGRRQWERAAVWKARERERRMSRAGCPPARDENGRKWYLFGNQFFSRFSLIANK